MKSFKKLGLSFAGLLFVAGISGVTAQAAAVNSQTKDTPATVEINDNGSTDPDPFPEDQDNLLLTGAPANYSFSTTLKNSMYTVQATGLDDGSQAVSVFNDKIARDWSVQAKVKDDQIETENGKTAVVNSFKVNDKQLVGTGATGIVAVAASTKDKDNNTGTIKTPVTSAEIQFTDTDNALKAGDKLTGLINYKLYNTVDAK
ncbi:hypothetical protein ACQKTA_07055 [Enterococcus sp. 22-H-5-01]|uniref:hypothetical protein n=1 Tax=Enterococcus sp. 22-H-5-01 TaxID=3418555 RepID=UPI003CFBE319